MALDDGAIAGRAGGKIIDSRSHACDPRSIVTRASTLSPVPGWYSLKPTQGLRPGLLSFAASRLKAGVLSHF